MPAHSSVLCREAVLREESRYGLLDGFIVADDRPYALRRSLIVVKAASRPLSNAMSVNVRAQRPRGEQGEPPVRRTAGFGGRSLPRPSGISATVRTIDSPTSMTSTLLIGAGTIRRSSLTWLAIRSHSARSG